MICNRHLLLLLMCSAITSTGIAQKRAAKKQRKNTSVFITIDGAKKMQRMEGIGVNANTSSWNDGELKPAIDFLIDSMHARIWRVITESVVNWEDSNDNNDPFIADTAFYHALYETPKFQKVWAMIDYLNSKGITDNLILNFMGAIPKWMGGERVLPQFEDEYIEMLSSFFDYARHVKHLRFGLISLMNESDITKEGPTVNSVQYVKLLDKLIVRLHDLGIDDVKFIAPDVARMDNGVKDYIPHILQDTMIMQHLAHIGLHSYQGYAAAVDSLLQHSKYPATDYWMTEWNNWCQGCDDGKLGNFNYDFGSRSVEYLFQFLQHGATAALIWEAYDSKYEHDAPSPISYWGMLAYDPKTKTYTPRKYYYVVNEVSAAINPGATRIGVTGQNDNLSALAFIDPSASSINVVGINKGAVPILLRASVKHAPLSKNTRMSYTNAVVNRQKLTGSTHGNMITVTIPPHCVFSIEEEKE